MPRKNQLRASKTTQTISTRLPVDLLTRMRKIMRESGSSLSEVVIAALERYCQEDPAELHETPYQFWKKTGLIGSIKDKRLNSLKYKDLLTDSLRKKHGHS